MSFGYSAGDAILITQLAWRVIQNSRKACGEHDELTQQATSLHLVLQRFEKEVGNAESLLNNRSDGTREECLALMVGSGKTLKILDQVLEKYNGLSDTERKGRKLWLRVRFGNGKVADMAEIRGKLTYYTSALSLYSNMVSIGSAGRVEQHMRSAGTDLNDIRTAVNSIAAHLMAGSRESSVLTSYAEDERAVWKQMRRELIADGFNSSVIRKHKSTIQAYIKELAERGVLDEQIGETNNLCDSRILEGNTDDVNVNSEVKPILSPLNHPRISNGSALPKDREASSIDPKDYSATATSDPRYDSRPDRMRQNPGLPLEVAESFTESIDNSKVQLDKYSELLRTPHSDIGCKLDDTIAVDLLDKAQIPTRNSEFGGNDDAGEDVSVVLHVYLLDNGPNVRLPEVFTKRINLSLSRITERKILSMDEEDGVTLCHGFPESSESLSVDILLNDIAAAILCQIETILKNLLSKGISRGVIRRKLYTLEKKIFDCCQRVPGLPHAWLEQLALIDAMIDFMLRDLDRKKRGKTWRLRFADVHYLNPVDEEVSLGQVPCLMVLLAKNMKLINSTIVPKMRDVGRMVLEFELSLWDDCLIEQASRLMTLLPYRFTMAEFSFNFARSFVGGSLEYIESYFELMRHLDAFFQEINSSTK